MTTEPDDEPDSRSRLLTLYAQRITALEGELAEARSTPHGEVLARVKTNSRSVYGIPGRSQLDAYLSVPPGTEVLVVRAPADQGETDGE